MDTAILPVLSALPVPAQKTAGFTSVSPITSDRIVSLLRSCTSVKDFSPIHAKLITTNLINDPSIASHLLWLFMSINRLDYVRLVVTCEPETIIWNTLLKDKLEANDCQGDVLLIYCNMLKYGVPMDVSTFQFSVNACSKISDVRLGHEVHGRILKSGFGVVTSLRNNLMSFYAKRGKLKDVCQLFDELPERNVISWNTMISCYVRMGNPQAALALFHNMLTEGIKPDSITMVSLLSACTKLRDLNMGETLFKYMKKNRFEIAGTLLNCLVDMYAKCGDMEKAHRLVDETNDPEIDVVLGTTLISGYLKANNVDLASSLFNRMAQRNLITWMTMISGCFQGGYHYKSLDLFRQMRLEDVVPNAILLVTALCASIQVRSFRLGRSIHSLVIKYQMDVKGLLANALIDFYAKCDELDEASLIFTQLPEKTIVSWNCMLNGFCKSGDLHKAKAFFAEITAKNVISWNTIISCYSRHGWHTELFNLFHEMQKSDVKPDKATLVSLLSSCASTGALANGLWIHVYIRKNHIEVDNTIGTALIDMYGKCGSIEKAYEVFCEVKTKNVFVWTALIGAYAMEGQAKKAVDLFTRMVAAAVNPDHVTFTALLSACSYGGLVDEGYNYFNKMKTVYNITPRIQHYGCIVDLLVRVGQLEEAVKLIKTMPMEADVPIWTTLLRACVSGQHEELATFAFKNLVEIDPLNDGAYVLLANVYARAGRWDGVSWARKKLHELGVKKQTGYSMIELHGVVHAFTCGDFSKPQSAEIHSMLVEMETSLSRQKQEESFSRHSEKLAVAYALLSTPKGTPIRVVNNLRICGECHTTMKLISHTYGRELIIRDNYRFHRFQNGQCSCNDYW